LPPNDSRWKKIEACSGMWTVVMPGAREMVNKVRDVNERKSRVAAREKKFKLDKRLTRRRSRRAAVSTIYV
jgi:hypothetical protein